ncbi:porin [Caballeronia sp. 15711]|uniref:porin n=1 Tax=Caballeronia sp. 15711 TaxID=3391029 RepID=UPI0039E4F535
MKTTTRRTMRLGLASTAMALSTQYCFAQSSSVTLYGIADAGLEYVNNTPMGGSRLSEASGNLSGSRWGLRGIEDLGGGLKAIFNLESGFSITDGTSAQSTRGLGTNATTTSRLFGRQAWVGLSSAKQQLRLGRQLSIVSDIAATFDPMGTSARYSSLSLDYAMSSRIDNSIKYIGAFGPLTLSAMYSTRYDTGYGAEVPGAQITGRYYGGSAVYTIDGLSLTAAFDQRNGNTLTTNTSSEQRFYVAGMYQIGPATAYLGYRLLRVGNAFLPTNPVVPSTVGNVTGAGMYQAGMTYQITSALQITGVAYYNDVHGSSNDSLLGVLSADYSLSKRTDLYATAAYTHNKGRATLGVNGYATAAAGYDQTGINVGIRHRF